MLFNREIATNFVNDFNFKLTVSHFVPTQTTVGVAAMRRQRLQFHNDGQSWEQDAAAGNDMTWGHSAGKWSTKG